VTDLLPCFDSYANITSCTARAENTWQSPAEDFSSMADFLSVQKAPGWCPSRCPCCLWHGSRTWQRGCGDPATARVTCSMLELWGCRRLGVFPDPLVSRGLQNKAPCLPLNVLGILKLNAIAIPVSSVSCVGCMQAITTAKFPVSPVNDTKVIDIV